VLVEMTSSRKFRKLEDQKESLREAIWSPRNPVDTQLAWTYDRINCGFRLCA